MKYEIAIIADPIRKLGFDLAGISGTFRSENKEETMLVLRNLVAEQRFGIVIIMEHLVPEDEEFRKFQMSNFPAIIIVPSTTGNGAKSSSQYLKEFIQRSIGVSIRI